MLFAGLSNFGDTLRSVTVTVMLFKMTGSGISAGLGLALSVLPGLVLSPIAGVIGDILPEKYMIIAVELLRGAVTVLFINCHKLTAIYLLLVILSSLDVLLNPPSKKICVRILGKENILQGNAILGAVYGLTNIAGAALTSYFMALIGKEGIFLFNSILHCTTALLLTALKINNVKIKKASKGKGTTRELIKNLKCCLVNIKDIYLIKNLIITFFMINFGMISINLAFHPYAFEILNVTEKGWGLIISIYYSTSIAATLIALKFSKLFKRQRILIIYFLLLLISGVWFCYCMTSNLLPVLLLQMIEGTAMSLCTIAMTTQIQMSVRSEYLSRLTGLNDFMGSLGKAAGMLYGLFMLYSFHLDYLFIINSIILMLFSLAMIISSLKNNNFKRNLMQ
jgi:MFS family permease